jgi:hypothetical protein
MRSVFARLKPRGDSSASQSVDLLDATNPSSNTSDELCDFCRNLSIETLCHPRSLELGIRRLELEWERLELEWERLELEWERLELEWEGGHIDDSESEDDVGSDLSDELRRHGGFQRLKLYELATDCRFCQLLRSLLQPTGITDFEYITLWGEPYGLGWLPLHEGHAPGLRESAKALSHIGQQGARYVMRNSPKISSFLERYDPISRICISVRLGKHHPKRSNPSFANLDAAFRKRRLYLKVFTPPGKSFVSSQPPTSLTILQKSQAALMLTSPADQHTQAAPLRLRG